jgi:hypothetical protein
MRWPILARGVVAMVIYPAVNRANCGDEVLDKLRAIPRMRAPMHPNYRISFARPAFAALPQSPILADRRCVPACAPRNAGEPDVLMR